MRDRAQPFGGDQLSGRTADAIGFVLNADQRGFQLFDKFFLTCGQLVDLFLYKSCRTILQRFTGDSSIVAIITRMAQGGRQVVEFNAGILYFLFDQLFKFCQFLFVIFRFWFVLFHVLITAKTAPGSMPA
jgi:hypothetical protein